MSLRFLNGNPKLAHLSFQILNVTLVLQNKYVLSMQLHFPISLINFFSNNINIFGFLGNLTFEISI
jgi:hypothetical protein